MAIIGNISIKTHICVRAPDVARAGVSEKRVVVGRLVFFFTMFDALNDINRSQNRYHG